MKNNTKNKIIPFFLKRGIYIQTFDKLIKFNLIKFEKWLHWETVEGERVVMC